MAALPDLDMVRVRRWADQRIPEHVRDEIRIEVGVRGSSSVGPRGGQTGIPSGPGPKSLSFATTKTSNTGRCTGPTGTVGGIATGTPSRPTRWSPSSRRSTRTRPASSGDDRRRTTDSSARGVRFRPSKRPCRAWTLNSRRSPSTSTSLSPSKPNLQQRPRPPTLATIPPDQRTPDTDLLTLTQNLPNIPLSSLTRTPTPTTSTPTPPSNTPLQLPLRAGKLRRLTRTRTASIGEARSW